jgi:uncharacterized protein (TIGR03435 family)
MFFRRILILAAVVMSIGTLAQHPAAPPLAFEVATIKPTARTDGHWSLHETPDGYVGVDVSLFKLVQEAYGLIFEADRITGGPPWLDRDKFDVIAKFDAADFPEAKKLSYRQHADMLRPLLADRFKLNLHHESREFPVYDLVVGKGGFKLKESDPASLNPGEPGCHLSSKGYQGCSMTALADYLHNATGRTVINKTGLSGVYDYTLAWSTPNTPPDSPAAAYPSIFTAVQEQLGLKLEPSTTPLDILVIDSAEKPSEN